MAIFTTVIGKCKAFFVVQSEANSHKDVRYLALLLLGLFDRPFLYALDEQDRLLLALVSEDLDLVDAERFLVLQVLL